MQHIIILDGGMGRELHRRGAPFRQPEWSALALTEAPETVRDTHLAFIQAGAQVITTNSYAIVPFHIGETRFAHEATQLAQIAANMAREAVQLSGKNVQIASSFPPLFGSYRPDLFDKNRATELAAPLLAGLLPVADICLAETVSSIAEAQFWCEQLAQSGKPVWLSFTLDDTAPHHEAVLRSGETVAQAAQWAQNLPVAALLFNCSQAEIMAQAVASAKQNFTRKIGVYANAFEPTQGEMLAANDGLDPIRTDTSPEFYADIAQQWVNLGAEIVGGCCGIAPEHIAALAKRFQAAQA